jgi:DNA polymerase-3 subunit epsilon
MEVVNPLVFLPNPETFPVMGKGARGTRSALAGLALLLVGCIAVDIYLLMVSKLGASQMVLALLIQGSLLMAAIAMFWTWLETRILHPLRVLEEDIDLAVHGSPPHGAQPPAGHALGRLPEALNRLAEALSRARVDTTKAMHSAQSRAERRSARLEAILRDLSEAVVVCTLQHRVVLYNDAASELLSGSGKLGIGRMLTTVLQPAALRGALGALNRQVDSADDTRGTVHCECALFEGTGKVLDGHMRLVIERDGSVSGYVLVFGASPTITPVTPAAVPLVDSVARPDIDMLERPTFYDFDLFDQDFDGDLLDTPLRELSLVVFDTETTGLEPSRGDQIVQIAGVRVLNGRLLDDDRFDELVNPCMPIPKLSTRIHGISDEMVAGKDSAVHVLRRFHAFIGDAVLVAHNAAFDMKFLKLKEQALGVKFDFPVLDTLLLSVVLQPSHETHTLDAIANRFGIENHDRHSALGDSVTTAEVLVAMIDVLEARGITTLGQALEASDGVQEIKRLQERF